MSIFLKTIIANLLICIQILLQIFLTRIRNAVRANHKVVEIPASNLKKKSQRFYSIKDIS